MKFCLWKITSLGLNETSCFSSSNYLTTAVSLQHARFGILVFATSVGLEVEEVRKDGSEGLRTMLPSWLNFSLLIAPSQPAAFAKTHNIKGGRLTGAFQRPQPRSYPKCCPMQEATPDHSSPENLQKNVENPHLLSKSSNQPLFPMGWAKIPHFKSSQLHIRSLAPSRRYTGTWLWRQMSCWTKGLKKVTGDRFQPQKGFGCLHRTNDKIIQKYFKPDNITY